MRRREDRLKQIREGQAQAFAKRQELIERARASAQQKKDIAPKEPEQTAQETDNPFAALDRDAAIDAAQQLRFVSLEMELGSPTGLNRPTIELLRCFLQCLVSRTSASVLQWPFGQRDVSLLHPLAMAACLCAPEEKTTGQYTWCESAHSFRTLYFPWRGGATLASQRSLLIRRNELVERNKFHLTRRLVQDADTLGTLDKLHETVGHLGQLSQRDQTKPHLAHPTLAEIYPRFVAEGGEPPPPPFTKAVGELFGRVRYGAALDRLTDHRPSLSSPSKAPFGLFGVSPLIEPRRALSARAIAANGPHPNPPDICVIDLGPPALSRLGANWSDIVEAFIAEAKKRFPSMPFLGVTQDPFVHQRFARLVRAVTKAEAPRSRVIIRVSRDPLASDPEIETVSDTAVDFVAMAGPTADAVEALSRAARTSSDPALAGTLRREMGAVRRAASLPCGLSTAYDTLCDEIGQAATEAFLEYRSRGTLLAPIDDALNSEIGGTERSLLGQARDAVESAFDSLENETPIGSLLLELVKSLSRKSSRSLIAFATDTDRLLAEHRLTNDAEIGETIKRRLERGHIGFTSAEELDDWLDSIQKTREKNTWKKLVLVAPNQDWLAKVVAREWLPDELIVLSERTFVRRVADTYHRLSAHPDLAGPDHLGGRLARVAQAAKSESEARGVETVDLSLEPAVVTIESDAIIDVAEDDPDDGSETILMTLASGRLLKARPASTIVRYVQDAELNPFERAAARTVESGDTIIVPDNIFIQKAREILPIRVLAQSWVEIYHSMVQAQLPSIPGATLNAKARHVLDAIQAKGARTQSQGAVLDWLRVEEHMRLPPEQRQPHAPQRRREFDAFVSVLGVNEAVADKMWMEGIQPLRIDRRRAGQRMAQAFVSVLVDPHGTASGLGESIRKGIEALRREAVDHIDQVIAVKTFDSGGADD